MIPPEVYAIALALINDANAHPDDRAIQAAWRLYDFLTEQGWDLTHRRPQ